MLVTARALFGAIIVLLCCNGLLLRTLLLPHRFALSVLPVAKGEAILLADAGAPVLINAGADASVLRALGTALPFWERGVEALILTDLSAANAGGVPEVLERYSPGIVFRTEADGPAAIEKALALTPARTLVRGTRILLGGGAYADVLWPPSESPAQPLLLRVTRGGASALIGDLDAREARWEHALDAGLPDADLLLASTTPPGTYVLDGTDAG